MVRRSLMRSWALTGACALGIMVTTAVPAFAAPYRVHQGDTYWSLSRQLGVSVARLEAANPNHPAMDLYPGLVLNVPGRTSPAAARTIMPAAAARTTMPARGGAALRTSTSDLRLIAQMAVAEEGNRPYLDQLGVAAVISNRLHHGGFGSTVRSVLFAHSQFTSVVNGYFWSVSPTATAMRAARAAAAGTDPTGGALYFFDPGQGVTSSWIYSRNVTTVIDGTVYAR